MKRQAHSTPADARKAIESRLCEALCGSDAAPGPDRDPTVATAIAASRSRTEHRLNELEAEYAESGNVMCCIDATAVWAGYVLSSKEHFPVPPWVAAYWGRACVEIAQGGAVSRPSSSKVKDPLPSVDEGVTHQHSNLFYGVDGSGRLDLALDALGLKTGPGSNVLYSAHNAHARADRVQAIEGERSRGHTLIDALAIFKFPEYWKSREPELKDRDPQELNLEDLTKDDLEAARRAYYKDRKLVRGKT